MLRILIVDANPAIQEDLRRILTNPPPGPPAAGDAEIACFEIDTARAGAEALEMVIRAGRAGQPYAIAFVDVRAALGLESIVQLWKEDASLQVVACAVAFDFSWETIAARLGVNGNLLVLRKPFASVEVLQMAHTLGKKWVAAQLTRQFLAFSQRQVLRPRVLQLNAFLAELTPLLRGLVGEGVELRLALADDVPPVWADPAGIEQIVVNLVLNARDAMPYGGGVTIATRAERPSAMLFAKNPEVAAGGYVRLSVIDTGVGMDDATLERIFEPFFTTKPVGKGTGMGLAAALGIARQHGGWIDVVSAPGEGAAFAVFLMVTQRTTEPAESKSASG